MTAGPLKILVVAPAWVGDMVMSQVIYARIKSHRPDTVIDVLAPAATLSLAERMPEVARTILIDQRHGQLGLGYRRNLGRALSREGYDQAIVTPNSLKSALVPFFAGIPKRTGFLGEYRYFLLNDLRLLDTNKLPRMVDRFDALAGTGDKPGESITPPVLMVSEENQEHLLTTNNLTTNRPIVGICPGAEFGDAKKWPEAHYIALAQEMVARGSQVWIFGSHADADCGAAIATAVPDHCTNLTGKTTLIDAIDLLALCESVVTNDSGLMHIAAAVGARVLAIYGSTSPDFTPPLRDDAEIISLGIACSPCFKRECPLGHKDCLVKLTPARVLDAMGTRVIDTP